MTISPEIQQILDTHSELELSEWSADPLPADHHLGNVPDQHPDPGGVPDAGVPVDPAPGPVCPPVFAPSVTAETTAPRRGRRTKTPTAPVEGGNGESAPDLADVFRTIPEVAALLHWHPGSVWRAIHDGRLPSVKAGHHLIPASAIHQFIVAQTFTPRTARRRKEPHGQA